MAFAGVNVTFGYVSQSYGDAIGDVIHPYPLGSQNGTNPFTTTAGCPSPPSGEKGICMATIYAAADSWITVGGTPADPASDPAGGRIFVKASTYQFVLVKPGDKVRSAAA